MRNHTLVILFSLFFLLTQPSPGLLDDMLTKSPGGSPTPAEPESPTPAPEWIKTVETALHKGIQHGADAMEKPLEAVKPHIKDGRLNLVTQAFEGPRYALRSGQYKYIPDYGGGRADRQGRGEQLYNLNTDPGEQHNSAPQHPGRTAALRALLQELTHDSAHR